MRRPFDHLLDFRGSYLAPTYCQYVEIIVHGQQMKDRTLTAQDGMSPQPSHRRVPAVSRAVAILRHLGAADGPMGVNRIARDLGLVPSTCLHILRVLADEGLVRFDGTSKRYEIGVGILPIARAAIQRNDFASLGQPRLERLSGIFGVTSMATQLLGDREMIVVGLSPAPSQFRLSTELGSRFPAYTSATGRCVAAFGNLEGEALRRGFDDAKWDDRPDFADWIAEVDRTRNSGVGIDRGRFIRGVTSIAVPLFGAGGAVERTIVAIGISERIDGVGCDRIAEAMLKMRDEIAESLVGG